MTSTCAIGALKAPCLTWLCGLWKPEDVWQFHCSLQGDSMQFLRDHAAAGLEGGEVLMVEQTNVTVTDHPALNIRGLCHLQTGGKDWFCSLSSWQRHKGHPLVPRTKQEQAKGADVEEYGSSAPEMSNPEVHGTVSSLDWSVSEVWETEANWYKREQNQPTSCPQTITKNNRKAARCTRNQESFLRRTNSGNFLLLLWKKSKRINSKISVPRTATFPYSSSRPYGVNYISLGPDLHVLWSPMWDLIREETKVKHMYC